MENKTTHECFLCGRVFDDFGKPEVCNQCLNSAHHHHPRHDTRGEVRREATDTFYAAWDDYTGEYE